MIAVQETTVWAGDHQANHIYLMDGDHAVAYIPKGKHEPFYFKKSLKIFTQKRTFKPVNPSPFKDIENKDVIEVQGSSGTIYFVNTDKRTCTCPGFQFRSNCKHLQVK